VGRGRRKAFPGCCLKMMNPGMELASLLSGRKETYIIQDCAGMFLIERLMMCAFFPKEDTYSYRGWLVSDHFWKRAFGVFGYGLAAEAVIILVLLLILVVLEIVLHFMTVGPPL
jgi:hypothetical protein